MSIEPDAACSANYTKIDDASGHDFWAVFAETCGALLSLLAGALLALSITVQRYALAHPSPHAMPLLCCHMTRPAVWSIGLAIYLAANGLFAYSSTLAPLTLASTMYTLLLVWNLAFAALLLKERVTRRDAAGAGLIVVGATLSVVGTPGDAPNTFGVDNIAALALAPAGVAYLAVQLGAGLFAGAGVVCFERRLARRRGRAAPAENDSPSTALLDVTDAVGAANAAGASAATAATAARGERLMAVVYPMALGLLEGMTQLTVKALSAMAGQCLGSGLPPCCFDTPTLWVFGALFCGVGALTLIGLRLVYARYTVTLGSAPPLWSPTPRDSQIESTY